MLSACMETGDRSSGTGQPGNQEASSLETQFLSGLKSLHSYEGKVPDAWTIFDMLSDISSELTPFPDEPVTPERKALSMDVTQVKNAFLLDAFPYFDERHQRIISRRIHGVINGTIKSQESFILNERQKSILQRITTAAGIPDNPGQRTYSYSSIPPPTNVVQGSRG